MTAQRTVRPLGIGGNPTVTDAVPGAMLEVGTRGSHRGGAAVAVNRTGSRHPEGVGHVRLGESTPVHRTRLELRVPQCPTSRPCARDVFTPSPPSRSRQVDGRRLRPRMVSAGEITYSYRRPWDSDASVIGLSGTESGPRGRDHGTPGGHRGRRRSAHFVYTCRKPNATPMT